ncbi:MAG: hypothetical protein OXP75_02825 [Rhodospirillales bacterium]|nr:hypothetical protein [Rhodospirillales bacterium]
MSAIVAGGRAWAAGLYWLGREGPRATARTARRLNRPWCVHHGGRTGFAAADAGESPEGPDRAGLGPAGLHPEGSGPGGLPAPAPALLEHLGGAFWMALVEGEADPSDAGGRRRFALVKARDGAVLADGDEVFDDRGAALAAFERARGLGWALHATPGLLPDLDGKDEVTPLEPAALAAAASRMGTSIALGRVRPAAGRMLVPPAALIGIAALIAAGALWLQRDTLVAWLAPPAPAPAPAAVLPEPEVSVSVDPAALIAACRRALAENPPFMPGWRIERIGCAARFADAEIVAAVPGLVGRAVLLVRWRLAAGHAGAVQRRVAEAHLGRRHAAAVSDGRAWAAAPLDPVLREADGRQPPFLALRRAVDRSFGARGALLGYAHDADGGWRIAIEDPGPLSRLAALAGGIGGLEVTALSRGAEGRWRLEARPLAPERMTASQLRALGVAADGSRVGAGIGSDDGKEVPHGTRHRGDS